MTTTEQDLQSFTLFVKEQMESGDRAMSIDELFDQWRIENPSDKLYAENVAAINASILDFQQGERGTVAGEHSDKLRLEYGLPKK